MKKTCILLTVFILVFSASFVFAQESDVTYIEGWVDIKDGTGQIYELFAGDRVYYGDTVITGYDGVAELEPQSGSRIIVQPDTVFSIKQTDINGTEQSIVSTTLGQVTFKFNKMTKEPLISTPSAVMGVRGTEFTVYAGADGSSLVTVDSGAVEISGKGESVLLTEAEGVEIKSGMAPGEKFKVMAGQLNFSSWNKERINEMMNDPSAAVAKLSVQLDELAAQLETWAAAYTSSRAKLELLRSEQKQLFDDDKIEAGKALNEKEVRPMEFMTSRLVLNYRYYALSALSMRQHIFSGFYTRMKTAFINDRQNPVYTDFLSEYGNLLEQYKQRVQPYLVDSDY